MGGTRGYSILLPDPLGKDPNDYGKDDYKSDGAEGPEYDPHQDFRHVYLPLLPHLSRGSVDAVAKAGNVFCKFFQCLLSLGNRMTKFHIPSPVLSAQLGHFPEYDPMAFLCPTVMLRKALLRSLELRRKDVFEVHRTSPSMIEQLLLVILALTHECLYVALDWAQWMLVVREVFCAVSLGDRFALVSGFLNPGG